MYFEFSQEFADSFKNNPASDLLLQILHNACCAMRNGQHIIGCESRTTAKTIRDTAQNISEGRIERYFHYLFFNHAEIASCKQKCIVYIRIIDSSDVLRKITQNDQQVIEISPDIAECSDLWQKTELLLEDSADDYFFEQICNYIKEQEDISLTYKIKSLHGGGGRTCIQLQRIQTSRKQLCLCVVDSDKHSPASSEGDTAKSVRRVYDKNMPLAELIILPCHELENLFLSPRILEKITEHDGQMRHTAEIVTAIANKCPEILLFFDLKSGYAKDVIENDLFWRQYLGVYPPIVCTKEITCLRQCVPCTATVINGFGRSYLHKIKEQKILEQLDCYFNDFIIEIKNSWKQLAYNIISWFCHFKVAIQ